MSSRTECVARQGDDDEDLAGGCCSEERACVLGAPLLSVIDVLRIALAIAAIVAFGAGLYVSPGAWKFFVVF